MSSRSEVLDYQQRCFSGYSESIGLPEKYTYPDGNPIRPLPPIQTQTQGLMIIGAYPSARFGSRASATRSGVCRLITVADNIQPGPIERTFPRCFSCMMISDTNSIIKKNIPELLNSTLYESCRSTEY